MCPKGKQLLQVLVFENTNLGKLTSMIREAMTNYLTHNCLESSGCAQKLEVTTSIPWDMQ